MKFRSLLLAGVSAATIVPSPLARLTLNRRRPTYARSSPTPLGTARPIVMFY